MAIIRHEGRCFEKGESMTQAKTGRRAFAALFSLLIAFVLAGAIVSPGFADGAILDDGDYEIDVVLAGGSGRASVSSPTQLSVEGGEMTATVEWSSPNYDLMIVDGENYLPINTEGNSVFEIPVSALDADLAIQAETTAMSQPHTIDYTLHFDSASATPLDQAGAAEGATEGGNEGVQVNKPIAVIGIIFVIAAAIFAVIRTRKMSRE